MDRINTPRRGEMVQCVHHESGFVVLAPVRHRREIRCISLDENAILWQAHGRLPQVLRRLVGEDAAERHHEPQLHALLRQPILRREAVQHGLEGTLRHLLFQHPGRIVLGLAGMDDEWQAGFTGRRDLGAEAADLRLAGRQVVVIVQPGLADAITFGCCASRTYSASGTSSSSWALCGCVPTVQNTLAFSSAIRSRFGNFATRELIDSIRPTPAASARANTAGRFSCMPGKSRWQWLSTTRIMISLLLPRDRHSAETPAKARARPCRPPGRNQNR